jgi:hypothetical protein
MNPFTALKNLSPFHFTSLILFFSLILSTLHFTLLCYSYLQLTSLHFTSLHSFLRLHAPLALQPESFQHVADASSLSSGRTQITTGPTLFLTTRLYRGRNHYSLVFMTCRYSLLCCNIVYQQKNTFR